MNIKGVPTDWEFDRFDIPKIGEFYWNPRTGKVTENRLNATRVHPILKQKPKKARPFANAAEFQPFRERWLRFKVESSADPRYRVMKYSNQGITICDGKYTANATYTDAFDLYCFEDSSPFGIEAVEE
jgi:hypothetical protein